MKYSHSEITVNRYMAVELSPIVNIYIFAKCSLLFLVLDSHCLSPYKVLTRSYQQHVCVTWRVLSVDEN